MLIGAFNLNVETCRNKENKYVWIARKKMRTSLVLMLVFLHVHIKTRTTDAQWNIFFIEIPKFWAWADKFGRNVLGHLGYFRMNYQHPIWYSESFVHIFHYSTLYPHPKDFFGIGIWIMGCKELGIYPSCVRSPWCSVL